MIFDTTFLIDLHREAIRKKPARAFSFLERHQEMAVRISLVTYAEFAEGFGPESCDSFLDLIRSYEVVDITTAVAWRYAQLSRELRKLGARIGDNDLWIAATAIDAEAPIVTRDQKHFLRVPGFEIIPY